MANNVNNQINIQEIVSQIVGSRQFCEELQRSVRNATAAIASPLVVAPRPVVPVRAFPHGVEHGVARRQELHHLFPSGNRNRTATQATSSSTNGKNRKRTLKQMSQEFKRDVILLKSAANLTTYNSFEKARAYENGFGFLAVIFNKCWSEEEVFQHLKELFSEKLNGDSFEIMLPMGRRLVKPTLAHGSCLGGSNLSTLFSQKIVYLMPLSSTSELSEQLEIPSEEPESPGIKEAPLSTETADMGNEIIGEDDHQEEERITEQFEEDTTIAINNSLSDQGTFVATLNWYRSKINEDETTYFNIYREEIYKCYKRTLDRETFSPWNRINVLFTDISNETEGAIDLGGPTREMFRLLLRYLKNSNLFEGPDYKKNLCLCNQSIKKGEYFEAGRIICLSIIHAGIGPGYLSNTLFSYLVQDLEFVNLELSDIANLEVYEDIKGVRNSSTLEELKNIILESQFLQLAGYKDVSNFSDKDEIVKGAIKFYLIDRMKPALDQFVEGLNTMEFLKRMQRFPTELEKLFCYYKEQLSARTIKSIFTPTLSEIGSNARTVEARILAFWADYLLDCEVPSSEVRLEEVFAFATGSDTIPVLGFESKPALEFLHNDDSPFPKANTCSVILYLPIHRQYETFKYHMNYGIRNGMVFGSA